MTQMSINALLAGETIPTRIIVVDHADTPFVATTPAVLAIRPPAAGGYACGVNLGLGALTATGTTTADIVIAMNNDVEVYPETLAALIEWWRTARQPGLVGAMVEEHTLVAGGGAVNPFTGRAILRSTAGKLNYIHGAFIAATYGTWLTLHGMPEHYFMYWEDALLGLMARQRGYRLAFAPTVRVKHHNASQKTAPHIYYLVRNGALYLEQELPAPWRWYWYIGNRLRYWWHRAHTGRKHRIVAAALADALAGVTGKAARSLL